MIRATRRPNRYRDACIREGADVAVHDPYVAEYPGVPIVPSLEEAVKGADAIVIFAGHHQYRGLDAEGLKNLTRKKHPVIIDGRNMIDPMRISGAGSFTRASGAGTRTGMRLWRSNLPFPGCCYLGGVLQKKSPDLFSHCCAVSSDM